MKTEYKYKGRDINTENYQKVIPREILWVILRMILFIIILIFGSTIFKVISGILMFFDILSFIALFLAYYVLHNIKKPTLIESVFNVTNSAKLMNVDLENDDLIVIKKKYRELSKKHHPDKYINDSIKKQEAAKRNFQKLNTAYNILLEYKKNQK